MLDLGDGYTGPHEVTRGRLGEGEDGSLEYRPSKLPMQLAQSILIVLADAFCADQAASSRSDFAAEGLEIPRLRRS